MLAAWEGHLQLVKLLIGQSAEVDLRNKVELHPTSDSPVAVVLLSLLSLSLCCCCLSFLSHSAAADTPFSLFAAAADTYFSHSLLLLLSLLFLSLCCCCLSFVIPIATLAALSLTIALVASDRAPFAL